MNQFESVLAPIAELLQRKNTDYGNSYDKLRAEYGELAFLIRIEDKLNRVKTLYKQGPLVTTENLEDSIKDIIGYCTLELVYLKSEGTPVLKPGGVIEIPARCASCPCVYHPESNSCRACLRR